MLKRDKNRLLDAIKQLPGSAQNTSLEQYAAYGVAAQPATIVRRSTKPGTGTTIK